MKHIILLGDGMADHPLEELGKRTPLQAASTPYMDQMARMGRLGLAVTVPPGMSPGSDVANLSVMGYDPSRFYSGRAPLEAAAMGVELGKEDIAFRCNLVTVRDCVMEDYSAGHISSEEGAELIVALRPLIPAGRIHAGVSYRNLLVLNEGADAKCTPPHDITGRQIQDYLPRGRGAAKLREIMEEARPILESHKVNLRRIARGKRPANMIWLWGQGKAPSIPSFEKLHNITGAVISAVDLIKGIGRYAGLEVVNVAGATGTIDTDYEGKVEAALDALGRHDFVFLHVEAPDEAAHEGNLLLKVKAIEEFDHRIVGPVLEGLRKAGQPYRACVLPDHPTPIETKTHSSEPVPFAMMGEGIEPDGISRFDEASAREGGFGVVNGPDVMELLLNGPPGSPPRISKSEEE